MNPLAEQSATVLRASPSHAEFLTHGLPADREVLAAFLTLSGVSRTLTDPPPAAVCEFVDRAHGARLAGEATPSLDRIVAARMPALVVSGGHAAGIERISDRLADRLGARRAILPGRGHVMPKVEGCNELVEAFWTQGGEQ